MISTLNSSYNRVSGLASGMDTETLVKQLTSATQNKIYAAQQQKQQIEWKQGYYREILTGLVKFNEKYFGTSLNSLTIGESLKQMTATSSDPQYVSAIGGSSSGSQSVYFSDIISLATSSKVQSSQKVSGQLSTEINTELISALSGKSMKVSVDGISKIITFSDREYSDLQAVADELTVLLDRAFGSGKVSVSGDNGILSLTAQNSKISLNVTGTQDGDAIDFLGFAPGSSNLINLSNKVGELNLNTPLVSEEFTFTINGESFCFDSTNTLSNIISTINNSAAGVRLSYSSVTDSFTLISKDTGAASEIVFQDTDGNFLNSILGQGVFVSGTDAEVKVGLNGATAEDELITLIRSSNTFEIDGTTYTLNNKASGDTQEKVTVSTAYNIEDMVGKITDFVNEYNKLIDAINSKLNEPFYRNFLPLTEEQKEHLSENEQKIWTEKAQSGLLRNDITLKKIVNELRTSLYDAVKKLDSSGNNLGFILPDIGITTKGYSDNGKLIINEGVLRKALSEKPEEVLALFTQNSSIKYSQYNTTENKKIRYEESGLLWRLSDIVKNNISKIGIKGPLVEMVGSPETNFVGVYTYSKKISDVEATISNLTKKLAKEQDSYWSKFTAMEKAINSLNYQSGWLAAQMPNN
ncbi:MAG: flagellar filament capping protein FliD [Bacillota bacterium]|jgi:flagellar hook-associated protein 2